MRVLVLAEHDNNELKAQTHCTITCARQLGDVDVLVAGANCQSVADSAATIEGVNKVLLADDSGFEHALAEAVSTLLIKLAADYDAVLAPTTARGKNILPRVAAALDVSQISDICDVVDGETFKRPIYAGNAIATVRSRDAKKIITVRTTQFDAAPLGETSAPVEAVEIPDGQDLVSFVSSELTKSDRPELTVANIVVSGGRGMGSGENFALLENLADKLNAAVGASRAAVDAGFVPNDYQVGQTGKVVAPELYIAVGISGAVQHLAGMKDSQVIVAINSDEEAPIFQVADYGLVADLFEVLPELAQALEE